MQRLVDPLHAIKTGLRYRRIENDGSDRNRQIVRDDAQECTSRVRFQMLELRQDTLDIDRLPGDYFPVAYWTVVPYSF